MCSDTLTRGPTVEPEASVRTTPAGMLDICSLETRGSRHQPPGSEGRVEISATDTPLVRWMTMTDNVTDEPDFETVVELLDDEFAREILALTSSEPMTVAEISDRSDAAASTLYRRVGRLQEAELLVEQSRIRSDGHHDTVYAATLEYVQISLVDGEFSMTIDRQAEDASERLRRLWRDL